MTEDWLRQRKLERLRQRWILLDEKLAAVQQQYDLEQRAEEQLRMKAILDQTRKDLDEVEADMVKLGAPLPDSGSNTQTAQGSHIAQAGPGGTATVKVTNASPDASAPSPDLPESGSVTRTVLELDMVGYNDLLHLLEENLGVAASAELNAQIQNFIGTGLQAVNLPPETVVKTTGDGAILLFEKPSDAHGFAKTLYETAAEFNSERKGARRRFRMGAATGPVQVVVRDNSKDIAGMVISRAVRLESAAQAGELLIDPTTYEALPAEIQRFYGPEETIPGKRDETYQVRRCRLSPEPAEASKTPTLDSVQALFKQLNPRDQLDAIMLRLNMPAEHQPSPTLSLSQREIKVIEWAKRKDGLKRLDAVLQEMIAEQENG